MQATTRVPTTSSPHISLAVLPVLKHLLFHLVVRNVHSCIFQSHHFTLAPPVLNPPTAVTATTLSLSWTQPGSAVDSYTVSYTYIIRQCGSGPISDSVEISNGNARSVVLDNLEEDSDYSITLTADIGTLQLDSDVVIATTNTAGIYLIHLSICN